jgi:hypothetical protein
MQFASPDGKQPNIDPLSKSTPLAFLGNWWEKKKVHYPFYPDFPIFCSFHTAGVRAYQEDGSREEYYSPPPVSFHHG